MEKLKDQGQIAREMDTFWTNAMARPGSRIWRWDWDETTLKPVRHSPLQTKNDIIEEQQDGEWVFIEEKNAKLVTRKIVIWTDIPKRVLDAYSRWKNTRRAFEAHFVASNVGIDRHYLRKLVSIMKSSVPFQPSRASEILPDPQMPPSRQKLPTFRVPATSPAPTRWTTGLRVEPSWKSQPRTTSSPRSNAVARAIEVIQSGKHIIFITGAGISVNAGNFRSQNGLYKRAGRDVFDGSTLKGNMLAEHHKVMGTIAELSQRSEPTSFHHMIAYLAEMDKSPLHRYYTQNIDGIEDSFEFLHTREPLDSKVDPLKVQLHGNLRYTRCTLCRRVSDLVPTRHLTFTDLQCTTCVIKGKKRKRMPTLKAIRPNVVLYHDDPHPDEGEISKVMDADWGKQKRRYKADRLIVVGTSAAVEDVQKIIKDCSKAVKSRGGKAVWIGLEKPPAVISQVFDDILLCDCQVLAHYYFEDVDFSQIVTKNL